MVGNSMLDVFVTFPKNALKLKNVSYFCVIAKSDRSIGK